MTQGTTDSRGGLSSAVFADAAMVSWISAKRTVSCPRGAARPGMQVQLVSVGETSGVGRCHTCASRVPASSCALSHGPQVGPSGFCSPLKTVQVPRGGEILHLSTCEEPRDELNRVPANRRNDDK